MKKIKVKIDTSGNIQIAVEGVKGRACKDLTKGLEKALGRVTADRPTSEMNEQEVNANVESRGQV